jgi:hypothetical protein
LYDSCFVLCDRMVIFATDSDLIHLSNNKRFIIDGIFKVVTGKFEPLLAIQAESEAITFLFYIHFY